MKKRGKRLKVKKDGFREVRKRKRERSETSKQITRLRKKKNSEQINATKKET